MNTYWDTSAVVALLLQEPETIAAQTAWSRTSRAWAWRWMIIETEAALSRRKAPPEAWSQWAALLDVFTILDLDPGQWDSLRVFNRVLRLRAADAGHLFVFERASTIIPDVQMVCFDRDMTAAARDIGLAVLT